MSEVVAVGIRRDGGEDDPKAQVVVEVQYDDGSYREVGRETLGSNFSSWWNLRPWKHTEQPRFPSKPPGGPEASL